MNEQYNQKTIMAVDDSPANLKLLLELLHGKGYRVVAFTGGAQALAAAVENPPDLILLDIWMPEMSGFEVCRRLKSDPCLRDIPVLFISALTETEDKLKAFAVGGADYITKPFQPEEVYARVQTHLMNSSLQCRLITHNEELERLVAVRTHELAEANRQLLEMSRLKADFLQMISHELRTPANGVLGMGMLLADMCPDTEECALYSNVFAESSARLLNLIEDATLIADMDQLTRMRPVKTTFSVLLREVLASLSDIHLALHFEAIWETFELRGEPALLKQALTSIIRLASFFCRNKQVVPMTGSFQDGCLCLNFTVDNMLLTDAQTVDFFRIESTARSASPAEQMGLAPVAAQKIVTAFGGDIRFVKKDGNTGLITVMLRCHADASSDNLP
jgi:two-component system sensor histidine kinase/response regulator